ncbi:MAG: ATP-binding cassette domain-containing protein [Nitrososphaeria archaeon]|nr:ATP-binding cassette domain-containing protein [Nitrososphaeria archaeon]MDW8022018.1 ATP-binding cassette domain-containing protein [Nitrososphaerota archaeon]
MNKVILECKGISKRFGYVQALKNVSFELYKNEVLGLVGDNAAGKSTLLKIIAGYYTPDLGEIFLDGKKVEFKSPSEARLNGIEMVYQNLLLAPNLSVVDNIFLGKEHTILSFFLNRREMRKKAVEIISKIAGEDIPLASKVYTLSGGQQQIVAIGRIFSSQPKVILMDEPTASLSVRSAERILEVVETLKKQGTSIIYVSHRLPDVLKVSDRVMLLRRGEKVFIRNVEEVTQDDIIRGMVAK